MLVTISGVNYFSYHTWSEVLPMTWYETFTTKIWSDLVSAYGGKVMANGPSVKDIVEDRSVADFTILDMSHAYSFQKGQYVTIRNFDFEVIFTGFIESVTQMRLSPDGVIAHNITCTDNHYLADKRLVAKAFVVDTTPTIADCVKWIVGNVLVGEGVTEGSIVCTTPIESISFDYVMCTEALDTLAQYGNCTWYIDYQKKLYFVARDAYPSAWNITESGGIMTDVLVDSFQVTSSNPEYRNQQYIRGGYAKTSKQTEISVGDGETSSFPVGYKIASVPTIYTNIAGAGYVQKTVGIKGVDTGKEWYWSSNDQIILQDSAGTRLTAADKIKIEYYGLYQVVTSSADYVEILARQAIEGGGSGIVDSMKDDPLVTTQTAGLDEANAILDHYAAIGTKIEYVTTRIGIEAGTLQHITSAIHGIDGDFLITTVEKCPEFYDPNDTAVSLIKYRITGISGPVEDYWTKFFLKLKSAGANVSSIANSTSVVLILKTYSHAWLVGDSPNIWTSSYADSPTTPSTASVPGFETGEKIAYISLWYGGTELFRKYYTAQTETAGSKIVTTFIIASNEANFTWDTIHVFGGDAASSTFGTGVDLYQIASPYTKNSLEALQVVITDTHW